MKELNIEFAPPRRTSAWLWGSLASALLALATDQARQAHMLHKQLLATERESTALSKEISHALQDRRNAMARARVEAPYARDAAAVAGLAGFPLDRMLKSIESARVQGIRLTALEVSAAEGVVRVELEVADNDVLIRYLEELNAGEPKLRWRLIQSQTSSTVGAGNSAVIGSIWVAETK